LVLIDLAYYGLMFLKINIFNTLWAPLGSPTNIFFKVLGRNVGNNLDLHFIAYLVFFICKREDNLLPQNFIILTLSWGDGNKYPISGS